ncbi:hypothetical protein [Desulfosporosinus sp. FKA]|uniref:hypothetical protein n=1 Tax=Desulfosporosinus sp. FKA TaxID=1969834 RepID=UPI000B4A0FB3|nr:hypothetical protein [Desulfosporosinus sp. FKA]
MHCFGLGDIFYFDIGFDDMPGESKKRPAIIMIQEGDKFFILVSTTTVPPHDPPKYFDQFKIPILNWRKSGLLRPSWGLGYKLIQVTRQELMHQVKREDILGVMPQADFDFLLSEIERIHKDL